MPGIADIIMQQMAKAGQPRMARETSTVTAPGEGLDIGSIMMMLMLSKLFKGQAPTETLGATGMPPARPMGDVGQTMGGIPNVGRPTPPSVGQTPTPPPRDVSGIPLQAPKNLQQLMMIVEALSKMNTNPYGRG